MLRDGLSAGEPVRCAGDRTASLGQRGAPGAAARWQQRTVPQAERQGLYREQQLHPNCRGLQLGGERFGKSTERCQTADGSRLLS